MIRVWVTRLGFGIRSGLYVVVRVIVAVRVSKELGSG